MKKLFILIIMIMCISVKSVSAQIELAPNALSVMLIEVESGKMIYARDENRRLFPASMTKLMTINLVLEAIEQNKIHWDDIVTTSARANSMGGSQIYLSVGEKMTVNDLFKAVSIASANDAAYALAEHVAGTGEAFIEMMNKKALEWGLTNTNFTNPTGLHEPKHYSSSYDMAYIARQLLINYEEVLIPFTSTYDDYLRTNTNSPFWLVNTNKLIKEDGIDGLKTGWTEEAGYCITATIKKNDNRFVAVVMGYENNLIRNNEVRELLNYSVTNYKTVTPMKKGMVVDEYYDLKFNPSKFNIILKDDLTILEKVQNDLKSITYEKEIHYENLLHQNIGEMRFFYDGKFYEAIPLVIEKKQIINASVIDIFREVFKKIFYL